jgi:hypothetical protein
MPKARAAHHPVLAPLWCCVEKPRVPRKRDNDGTPVDQVDSQGVLLKLTFFTRSPGLISEACIPSLHQGGFVLPEHLLDPPEFHRTELEVECQPDRSQPELGGLVVAIHMHILPRLR